jgi:hypothetical protein
MSLLETRDMIQKIKEFPVQAWWLEFDPQNPHQTLNAVACICDPSILRSVGQLACSSQCGNKRLCLKQMEGKNQILKVDLWPPHLCPHIYISYTCTSYTHAHAHTCSHTHTGTHLHMHKGDYWDREEGSVSRWLAMKPWIPDFRSLVCMRSHG